LDATTVTKMSGSAETVGVLIAFNSVGFDGSNLAFQLVDALLGSDYLIEQDPVGAVAYIEDSDIAAGGSVVVVAESREVLTELSAIDAQLLDDMGDVTDDEDDIADDAAAIAVLEGEFAAAGIEFDGSLSVETVALQSLWYVTDSSGRVWQVRAAPGTGVLEVARVNLLDATVGNESNSVAKNDRALFDAIVEGNKTDNKGKELKDLKYGATGAAGGGVLATNRMASETKAWISNRTADHTSAETVTGLRAGTRVQVGSNVYEYIGPDLLRVTAFDYTSRFAIPQLETGDRIRLHEAMGGYAEGTILEWSGSDRTDANIAALLVSNPGRFSVVNPALAINLSDASQSYATSANWALRAPSLPAGVVTAGEGVIVRADDSANIRAATSLEVSAIVENNMNAFRDIAAQVIESSYSYTTKSGTQFLNTGDLVRIATDGPAGFQGKVFRYVGLGGLVDLGALNAAALQGIAWQDTSGNTTIADAFPNFGNLANSDSRAIGGIIVTNDVRGTASARVENVAITATGGDISISAAESATLIARLSSTVTSSGGSAWGSGESLAVNAQIATNMVQASATTLVRNATLLAEAGDIVVRADNSAVLDSRVLSTTNTGDTGVGVTLAFNTLGWKASNLLFNIIDSILADPLISEALNGENPAQAKATVENTRLEAAGSIRVEAQSLELLNATVSNATISAAGALKDASGKSIGVVLASNKVSGRATAEIVNAGRAVIAGGDVTVRAEDNILLHSNSKIVSESTTSNDGGAAVLQQGINSAIPVDWVARPGAIQKVDVKFGHRVRLAPDFDGEGDAGSIYVFMGADALGAGMDINAQDYTNTDLWKLATESQLVPTGYNVTDSDSIGVGTMLVYNDLRSQVLAQIVNTPVTTTDGDITVTAVENATMNALVDAATSSSGGSVQGTGTSVAVGAIIATNMMLGGATARVIDSTLTAGEQAASGKGNITVEALNTADMLAENTALVATGDTGVGVFLAFNSVGWQPSNILFNTIDALLGDPLISGAFNGETPVNADAYVLNSTLGAAGQVTVNAENDGTISATTSNQTTSAASAFTDASGTAVGAVVAMNKLSGAARAYIDVAHHRSTDGQVRVATGDRVLAANGTVYERTGNGGVLNLAAQTYTGAGWTPVHGTTGYVNSVNAGRGVAVTARDANQIDAENLNEVVTTVKNDGGLSIVLSTLNTLANDYAYTTKSGVQRNLLTGEKVLIASDYNPARGEIGAMYIYVGAPRTGTPVDLGTINYATSPDWLKIDPLDFASMLPPGINLNVSDSDATAGGGMVALNDVRGRVDARVNDASVTSTTGDIIVRAVEQAGIDVSNTGTVKADGGSFFNGKGTTLAVNALIATNLVQARATATVEGSLLDADGGNVAVTAENLARVHSTIDMETIAEGGGTSIGIGVTLAFNSIGTASQNFLFNTVDALFGLLPAQEIPSEARARVTGSIVEASGDITVDARSDMDLHAQILNAALATSVSLDDNTTVSVAPIVALNRGSSGAYAEIRNAGTVTAGGAIGVTAADTSRILAEVVSAAASLSVGTGKALSVAVATTFARNTLRSVVDAGIHATGTLVNPLTAGAGLTVSALRQASIEATSVAVAASLSVSASGGRSIGVSVGGAVAVNRIFGAADASIEGSVVRAGAVTVDARSTDLIDAKVVAVAASASVSLGGDSTAVAVGVSVADNLIGWQDAPVSDSFTNTQTATLTTGTIVRAVEGAHTGRHFRYIGQNQTVPTDLSVADFGDTQAWQQVGLSRDGMLTSAHIDNSSILAPASGAPDLVVQALTEQRIVATVLAGAVALAAGKGGVSFGGAGAFARNRIASDATASITGQGPGALTVNSARVEAFDRSSIDALTGAASVAGQIGGGSAATSISLGVGIALNEISNLATAHITNATLTATGTGAGGGLGGTQAPSSVHVGAYVAGGARLQINTPTVTAAQLDDAAEEAMVAGPNDTVIRDAADRTGDINILNTLRGLLNGQLGAAEQITGQLKLSKSRFGAWVAVTEDGRSFNLRFEGGRLLAERASINSIAFAASIGASFSPQSAVAVSGAGAYAENVITGGAVARITGSDVTAAGDVVVEADSQSTINAAVVAASLALSVSGSTGVGVSIGVAIARNFIGQSRTGTPDAMLVQAYTSNSRVVSTGGALSITANAAQEITSLTFAGSAAIAAGSTGVAVSGSGVWNENAVNVNVLAAIDGKLTTAPGLNVDATLITVAARNTSEITALAGAASIGVALGSTGIAVSVGLGLAQNRVGGVVEARVLNADGGVRARNGGISVAAEDAAKISVLSAAASLAAGFGSTGVAISGAGAEATNRINTTTRAHVTGSDLRAPAGAVTVEADATGEIRALVVAASAAIAAGSTGIGASIGVAVARNLIGYQQTDVAGANTTAQSVDGLTKNVTMVRILDGARKGDVYRYVGDTVGLSDNDGRAYALNSQDYSDINAWQLVNLGESRAVIAAEIVGSTVTAQGAVTVDATAAQSIKAATVAGSVAIAAGSVGVAISGSGAGIENRIATNVTARIAGPGAITAHHVVVNADDLSTIDAIAAAFSIAAAFGATGISVAVGVSIAINEIVNNVVAAIDPGATVTTSGVNARGAGVTVSASTPELPLSGGPAPIVLTGLNANNLNDAAAVDTDEDGNPNPADVAGDRAILNNLRTRMIAAGLNVVGDLRISVVRESQAWTVIDAEGTAFALQRNGSNYGVQRAGINALSAAAAIGAGFGSAGIGVAGAGAVALNSIRTNVTARADGATIVTNGGGNVVIDARSATQISAAVLSVSLAVGAGAVGVGVGIGVSVAMNFIGRDLTGAIITDSGKVSAFARNSAILSGGSLVVEANSAQSIRAITVAGAVAIAGGKVGVGISGAGVYAENRINATTEAFIQGGSTTVSATSVTVRANDVSSIDAVGGAVAIAVAAGVVGVGVSVGVAIGQNTITSTVRSEILGVTNHVEARTGHVEVRAANAAAINSITAAASVAAGFGAVGISFAGAGAFARNIVETLTFAAITTSTVRTLGETGDVIVRATGDARINALIIAASAAIGGGAVGVGVSIGVSVAENRIGSGPGKGVFARITGSTVTSGRDVIVDARMDRAQIDATVVALSVALAGGAVAVSGAGTGADAKNTLAYAVIAEIAGSTITAADDRVIVDAYDTSVISSYVGAASIAGSVGAFGGSASIAVSLSENRVNNDVTARITGSSVSARDVSVTAQDTSTITATAEAAAVAVSLSIGITLSGSGARTVATNTNRVSAYVSGSGLGNFLNLTGDLRVSATATPSLTATTGTASVSLGLAALAAGGGVVQVTATPAVNAYVQNVRVVADEVAVTARGQVHGRGIAYGMSVSTGLSMGANVVNVTTSPVINAWAGGASSSFTVRDLDVTARTERNAGRLTGDAYAASSAGGLLMGVTSTQATVTNNETVQARLLSGAVISSSGVVNVSAVGRIAQKADANSAAVGLIGAGASIATAQSNATVRAVVGTNVVLTGNRLVVTANGEASNVADTTAGSGGLVSGAGAAPTSTTRATVEALIADGAVVSLTGPTGRLDMGASHVARPNTFVRTDSYGLIAGSGAVANTLVDADVFTRIGSENGNSQGATVTARDIALTATNTVDKPAPADKNLDGNAGGLASGASSNSAITLDLLTLVDFDNGSAITVTDSAGKIFARAFNDIRVVDEVALFTAGAISGAGAYVTLNAPNLVARVDVGTGAQVRSAGTVEFEAKGTNDIFLQSYSETYGLGTVALGHAKANLRPDNIISIGGTVLAERDVFLSAGTDKDLRIPVNSIKARVDNFAGSLIPISSLETEAIYQVDNTIRVLAGGLLESYANINLYAEQSGLANLDAVAKATNWISGVTNAIDSLLGGNNTKIGAGKGLATAYADVINDGTIRTGAQRVKTLTVTYDPATRTFSSSGTGNIGWSVSDQELQSSRFTQYEEARENRTRYAITVNGAFVNPDLVAFYDAQMARLLDEMLANGEAHIVAGVVVPLLNEVVVLTVDPVTAQAGRVIVVADQMAGAGTFDTPRDARIEITNQTHAFLVINGAEIPETNGGILFNGIDISVQSDPLAKILELNQSAVTRDNGQPVLPPVALREPALNFSPQTLLINDGRPEITIRNDFNIVLAALNGGILTTPVWPDIFVRGNVLNLGGNILFDNNSAYGGSTGDFISTAEINGQTVTIRTGGTAIIAPPAADGTIVHVAGEPYSQWKTAALTGSGATDAGMLNAERFGQAAIDAFLAVQPTTPSIYARRVIIDSEFVNVNGIIQSGKQDYHVTLGNSVRDQIVALRNAGVTRITALTTDNPDFQIFYDPTGNNGQGRVIVTELRPAGGYVDITGHVMNTRNGKIIVHGGYPDIRITNAMVFATGGQPELVVHRMDASQRGEGLLIIKDKAKDPVGAPGAQVPHTVIYTVGDNGVVSRSVNGVSGTLAGRTDTYTPQAGYRYGWTLAQATRTTLVEEWRESDWLGIDAFAPDSRSPDKVSSVSFPGVLLPDSNYFYLDAARVGDTYTFSSQSVENNKNGPNRTGYKTWSSWYGTNHTWFQYTTITDTTTFVTHTIKADRPIGIEFIGYATGRVTINGGAANVVVDQAIQNPTGHTAISTTGTIRTTTGAINGVIGGRTISITAGGDIGSELDPVRVDLSNILTTANRLDATSSGGAIHLREVFGTMTVGTITAGGGRDVSLSSHSGILRASGAHLITGGAITLTAEAGNIGTLADKIRLDTGTTARDVLRAYAPSGDVHVSERAGNLRVFEILAGGAVSVQVVAGDLVDANTNEVRDERAVSELRAGVWSDLSLTDYENGVFTGRATAKVQEAIATLENAKTAEYRAYWTARTQEAELRKVYLRTLNATLPEADRLTEAQIAADAANWHLTFRPGSAAFDQTALLSVTADEVEFYRLQGVELGLTGAALTTYVNTTVQTLRTSRTVQFRALDAVWGANPGTDGNVDTFDATYVVALTAEERAAIEGSIKIWTESELINAIGAGLLAPITDTDLSIEDPNIVGTSVTLDVSGSIGQTSGQVYIPIQPGVSLTDAQRLIIGSAERDDLFYLTTERFGATVNFDAAAGTITRTSGVWSTDLIGQVIQVEGNSANATEEGPFYTVLNVIGGTIYIDQGRVPLTQSEAGVAVFVSGLALSPRGVEVPAVVTISGGNTITRTDGGDFADFRAGMKLILRGDTENGNGPATLFTIQSVNGASMVLAGTPGLVAETAASVTLAHYVELAALQVQLREDFDIIASGVLNVVAGADSFIGSESALALGRATVAGDLRIRAQGNITNASGSGATNVVSDNLLLEAGSGAIGGAGNANRFYINLSPDATLTARSGGSIFVTERQGNMNVATIYSQSGDVNLVAQGSILDALNTTFVNIEANSITLNAQTGTIGADGNALDIEARGDTGAALGLLTATAEGSIVLAEQFGDMNIRNVLSRTGDVTLEAALSIFDAVDIADPTNPFSANLPTGTSQLQADVLAAGSITLIARLGYIGAFGNELDIDSRRGGSGVVNSQSRENAFIIETAGDMHINRVGVDLAGLTATAYLTAVAGGILNGAVAGASNVTGGRAFLIARDNIGTALNPIYTRIGTIQSISTTGSTYVVNDGALLVEVLDGGSGDGQFAGGEVNTTASSPITVSSNIIAASNITLLATESALADYDTITILAGRTLHAMTGNVTLRAGDHIVVQAGAQVRAGTDVVMTSDFGSMGPAGGDITVAGLVTAGRTIRMISGGDDDIITVTATGELVAGLDIDLLTGGGADRVALPGRITAGRDLSVSLGAGDDRLLATGAIATGRNIVISGEAGADHIVIDEVSQFRGHALLSGGDGDDRIEVIRLVGQNRATDSLRIDGGAGSDRVFIQTHGSLGGAAVDYIIDVLDTGAPDQGADHMEISGTDDDDFFLSRANFVALLHGTGAEIRGNLATRPQTVERINYDRNINGRVVVLGHDGDDTFIADDNSAIMTLDGGRGNDTFQFGQIFGVAPVHANVAQNGIAAGDDIAAVLTTRGWLSRGVSYATVAFGGDGNDTFTVYSNRAQVKLEGENGNDSFLIRAFLLDAGASSMEALTEVRAGDGDDLIQYNINAPVDIDGGAGFDRVIVLGTEADDVFVITENGVFGAGLNVRISNTEEQLVVDGLEGNDTFYVLSTAAGAVTHVIGGLGSDTVIVAGDVTERVISSDVEGRTGGITHQVTSGDPDYDNVFAAGIPTIIADANKGAVLINQGLAGDGTPGRTVVGEGAMSDIYSVVLATAPVGGPVYVTVSANRASAADRNLTVPMMAAGTTIGFAAGGTALTRTGGSWLSEGFEAGQTIVLAGAGDSNGRYRITSVTATQITVDTAFATTETALAGALVEGLRADSVLISANGVDFTDALVLVFDETNWNQAQSITVRAVDDTAAEGSRNVVISHSVMSVDPAFDRALVENVVVEVLDNDLAGVRILPSGTGTLVLEGDATTGISDSWDVVLTRAPAPGEVVTVTLSGGGSDLVFSDMVLVFDASNWNVARTVTVSAPLDGIAENQERITVTHSVSSTGGRFAAAADASINVTVVDGDTAGVLVRETGGRTLVVDQPGSTDDYLVRLTKAPTDAVTVTIFDDGQTRVVPSDRVSLVTLAQATTAVQFVRVVDGPDMLVRTTGDWRADGFAAGQTVRVSGSASNNGDLRIGSISDDGRTLTLAGGGSVVSETALSVSLTVEAAQITFDATNWWQDVAVTLEADPDFVPTAASYVTKTFPVEPHVAGKVRGPLLID
ncbi:MAG: hypothetical protein Q8K20_05785, partial [Gemmobacter sp.]|nr:hypothetical protein [Gemmobacter sp.]